VVLPVVAKDGQSVGDAIRWVLHLELHWVLTIVHLLVVLRLLDSQDSLLSIWLFRVDREDHIVGDQSFFGLFASLVEDSKVVPDFPKLVLQSGGLGDVLKGLVDLAHVVEKDGQRGPENCFGGELLGGL